MATWSSSLSALALLQSVHAITFSTLAPTSTHHVTSEPPKITPGLHLYRRDSSAAMETMNTILTDTPAVCGWFDTSIDATDPSTYACVGDNSCVYHMSNTAFPGLVGCCSGNDCGFTSICYNSATVAANPSIVSGNTAFALFCTESTAAECGTYTWGDADLTDFQCDSTAFLANIYTKGTWGGTADGTILLATQYISTIDDESLSAYSSSFDVSTSISKPHVQASLTGAATATTTAGQAGTAKSGNSGSSASAGTIAGSVVGGVAGAGAIGAIAAFLLMRKKKDRQQRRPNTFGQDGYQSVPKAQSGQSASEIQQPSDIDSHPAFSLQEGILGSAPQEIDSKTFVAELPVPDDGKHELPVPDHGKHHYK